MRSKNCWIFACTLVLLPLLAAGCSLRKAVKQTTPERRHFVLESAAAAPSATGGGDAVLAVRSVIVSPRFEGKGFVYKRGESEYLVDFYNQFLVDPDLMLSQAVYDRVAGVGSFGAVVRTGSRVLPTHAIEGRVNALYGDYTNRGAPVAVIEIEFYLVEAPLDTAAIVFRKRYREEVPFGDPTPQDLVGGWNTALNKILTDLGRDLGSVELRLPATEETP